MRAIWALPIALTSANLLTGCDVVARKIVNSSQVVQGSGEVLTFEPPVAEFQKIEVLGAIRATVEVGDDSKVVIRGDDNVVPLIRVKVNRGRLTIRPEPNTSYVEVTPLEVTITTRNVSSLRADGASTIRLASLTAERLDVEALGACTVTLRDVRLDDLHIDVHGASAVSASGTAGSARIDASGASKVELTELSLDSLMVDFSGSASGGARVGELVTGSLSGASNLRVHGDPPERSVESAGASEVVFVPGE